MRVRAAEGDQDAADVLAELAEEHNDGAE